MTSTRQAEPAGLAELKQFTRLTWATGNYPEVARRGLLSAGEHLVQRIGIGQGQRVLDVACGSGNAAIRAAQAGGDVVGLDLTPELLQAGQRFADQAGVTVDWVTGDAEQLPFDDGSFDVVVSTFGAMFAPRHKITATELARVLRSGGRLAMCNWTPEGAQGSFFREMGSYTPPLPPWAQPPLLWGTEDHVRDLFARTGITLEFDRAVVEDGEFESGVDAVEFLTANFGPLIRLRSMLTATGQWETARAKLTAIYDRHEPSEYLIVLGRKA